MTCLSILSNRSCCVSSVIALDFFVSIMPAGDENGIVANLVKLRELLTRPDVRLTTLSEARAFFASDNLDSVLFGCN